MPSLSFVDNNGKPVAYIKVNREKHLELKELNNKYIYLNDDNDGVDSIEVENVEIFPLLKYRKGEIQNHRLAVLGKSGSGKSYFIGQLLDILKSKKHGDQNRRIIILSGVTEDEALDRPRGLKDEEEGPIRIDLNDPELGALKIEDFEDSITIFDDTEFIANKTVNKFVNNLRNEMLEKARHHKIDIISVSHNALGGSLTRLVHSESTGAIFFPNHTQFHQLNSYLSKYIGLSKESIQKIIALGKRSRWIYVSNLAPCYVVYQRGIYLVK